MDDRSVPESEEERRPDTNQDEAVPDPDSYPIPEQPPFEPGQSALTPGEEPPSFEWEMASPEATYREPYNPPEPEDPIEGSGAEEETSPITLSPEATHAAPSASSLETELSAAARVGVYPLSEPRPELAFSAPPPPPAAERKYAPILPSGYESASQILPTRTNIDRGVALFLEILPGLIGFLGFGWIYAGKTQTGILWLAGFLFWNLFALLLDLTICFIPIHISVSLACLIISPIMLNNYLNRHPEILRRA